MVDNKTRSSDKAKTLPLKPCNVCNSTIQRTWVQSRKGWHAPWNFKWGSKPTGYKCPYCRSVERTRVGVMLIDRVIKPRIAYGVMGHSSALVVAEVQPLLLLWRKLFVKVVHVTLLGNRRSNCIKNVDLRELDAHFDAEMFDLVSAAGVLDYIPEVDVVFRQAFRVLRPQGVLFFQIQRFRLIEGAAPPRIKHRNALSHEQYQQAAKPRNSSVTGLPDVEFSFEWLLKMMRAAGFHNVVALDTKDGFSNKKETYFFGEKAILVN